MPARAINLRQIFSSTALLVLFAAAEVEAKFVRSDFVPVDRLIANVEKILRSEPNNKEAIYTLGRLHSLAFADGSHSVEIYNRGNIPQFGHASTPEVILKQEGIKDKESAMKHLSESLRLYRMSVEKDPKNALYWFSYAWVLEQGASFASEVDAPFKNGAVKMTSDAWKTESLKDFRTAFRLCSGSDLSRRGFLAGDKNIVSQEAALAILETFKGKKLTPHELNEQTRLQSHLKKIKTSPRFVTPIIFPLNSSQTYLNLTSGKRSSTFDLTGDGVKRKWDWVSPETGILVWDAKRTGKIKSGRQLFGSVTWWMFWENGYAPLQALDDNRDGLLTGLELRGISVWIDSNGNGISDPGEVTPANLFGIRAIRVRPDSGAHAILCNSLGIELKDGTTRPSYDWVPKSN